MIGLARMALILACRRVYDFTPVQGARVLRRDDPASVPGSCAHEYYAIIDRLARGEKP